MSRVVPSDLVTIFSVMDQFEPKLHNEVYPFVHPIKFKDSLRGKVTLLTGKN